MAEPLMEVVYTAEPMLRRPRVLIKSMIDDLIASRELAWRLFVRDLKARYRQSLLGYVWAFLPPVLTTFTFVLLRSGGVLIMGDTGIPYAAYVLVGTLLWQGFVDAMNAPIRLMTASKPMLTNINFPREALILAGLAQVLFNTLIRMTLLVFVFVWFDIEMQWMILTSPIAILSILIFGLMVGLLLSPMALLYTDISQGLPLVTTMWFFLTPVIYPASTARLAWLTSWNPVAPLLVTAREMLTTGTLTHQLGFVLVTLISIALLVIGWLIYRLAMPHLIERMSAS